MCQEILDAMGKAILCSFQFIRLGSGFHVVQMLFETGKAKWTHFLQSALEIRKGEQVPLPL
jgi:hypothetical protein